MVLAATPNQHSSGYRDQLVAPRTIAIESMAMMHCPSVGAIRTDINGPFLLFKGYMAAATHDWRRC